MRGYGPVPGKPEMRRRRAGSWRAGVEGWPGAHCLAFTSRFPAAGIERTFARPVSRMEHYRKAGSVELPAPSPMPQLPPDTLEMRVRDGSKIRNLLGLALGRLEGGSARHVVFSGSGRAAGKAVSCAEIVKRRVPGLHQLTKLRFLQTEDSWVPTSPDTGLDPLTVRRHVPAVWVLLSRDPLDPNECGYQPPGAPPGLGSTPGSSCGPRPRRKARDTRS